MATITFSVRYFFFSKQLKLQLNSSVKTFLTFTAPSILTAMWAPIVFGGIEQTQQIIEDPFLIAGIGTILLSLLIKNTLAVVLVSMVIFILIKNIV